MSFPQLLAAGYLCSVATLVFGVLPAIIGILSDVGKLRADQSGQIMAFDLGAQVIGTFLYLVISRRTSWRVCAGLGLVLMALGNGLSCVVPSFLVLIPARVVAGLGVGIILAACYALLSLARRPARAAGWAGMGQTAAVIAALWALPWLTSLVGWYSPFLMLAIAAVVSMLTLPVWSTGMRAQRAKFGVSISRRGLACLIGALIYYSGQAAAWGYLERIGTYEGISAHDVRLALTAAIVPGMLGSLMDYVVGRWISITAFLAYSLAITAVALLILSLQISPLLFAFAVTLFYFAWCASIPFQFAATVRADLQGDSAASLTAANSLGIAIGPAIAGGLFVRGAAPAVLVFAAICSVIGISFFVVSEISGAQQNLRREPCQ